jgi:hypothetical protein
MQKLAVISFAVIVIAATLVGLTLRATVRERPMMPRDIPRDLPTREQYKLVAQKVDDKTPRPRPGGKAVALRAVHEFGLMDPHESASHVFVIRNAGVAPLKLGDPQPKCHCATAELSQREIPPQGEARLTMRWTPEEKLGTFGVAVTVPTSDPDQSELQFRVEGEVRRRLDASPGILEFGDVHRDAGPALRQTLVFSHVWEQFEIQRIDCDLAGLTTTIEPATAAQLAEHQAKSGYVVAIGLPEEMPMGEFHERLTLVVRPKGTDDRDETTTPTYDLAAVGNVRGRISIFGSEIDPKGTIDLGVVQRGLGKKVRLILKIRDPDPDLKLRQVTATPSFIAAELIPSGAKPGLYYLDVGIPADAPTCEYLLNKRGQIHLEYDHPRVSGTKLQVRFAVATPETVRAPQ